MTPGAVLLTTLAVVVADCVRSARVGANRNCHSKGIRQGSLAPIPAAPTLDSTVRHFLPHDQSEDARQSHSIHKRFGHEQTWSTSRWKMARHSLSGLEVRH